MTNKLPKIISFSGRKNSGKTELSKICIKYNYELINFADSLKKLVCKLLNITLDYLEENKDKFTNKKYNLCDNEKIELISFETNIDKEIVRKKVSQEFNSIREILQVIGSNLIREHNPLWHVNKTREILINNPYKYYCIGDMRFLNEKSMVEELNGECWFIIRPTMFNISNHYSETELKWYYFGNNIIINNISKQLLVKKWTNYLENIKNDNLKNEVFGVGSKKILRDKLFDLIKDSSKLNNKSTWWCNQLMIQVNKDNDNDNVYSFSKATKESSYIMGLISSNGCIKLNKYNCTLKLKSKDKSIIEKFKQYLKSNKPIITNKKVHSFNCNNPFIIENIKLWNGEIPHLLLTNMDMLKYWIVGLIDGSGSICVSNNSPVLTIVASKKIIEYLYNILQYGDISNVGNKYQLKFYKNHLIDICNWLGEANKMGLNKNWQKIRE